MFLWLKQLVNTKLTSNPQIGVPDSLFDEMEAKYAPPDHNVFQLTPPPFDSCTNKYYEEMGWPPVCSNSFWNVYQQLLALFWGAQPSDDLTEVLSDLENRSEQIVKEKVDVLLGLKALRVGVTVVGDGIIDDDNSDSGVEITVIWHEYAYARMTAFCQIISANFGIYFTFILNETDNCIWFWSSDYVPTAANNEGNPVWYDSILDMVQQILSIAIYHMLSLPKP